MTRETGLSKRFLVAFAALAPLVQDPAATPPPQAPAPARQPVAQPPQASPIFGAGRGLEVSIEAAMELALANNLGLKIEDLASEAALYASKGSWGAFDWRVDANGGVIDNTFQSTSIFSGSSTNTQLFRFDLVRPTEIGGQFTADFDTQNVRTNDSFSAFGTATSDTVTLAYTQPLLRGAWRQYATSQQVFADLAWRLQLEHQREVRQRLLFDVSNAYWDLAAAAADRQTAESSLALAKTQLDQDKRRLEAGVGTPIDVVSADTQVAAREETLLAADVQLRERGDALRRLILPSSDAASWETVLTPSTPLPTDTSASAAPEWAAALDVALSHRAELRQGKLRIEELKVNLEQRRSEKKPLLDVSLAASGKGFSENYSEAFHEAVKYEFPTYQALLNFSYPIGNRTASAAERVAWTNLRGANVAYDDLQAQVASEVRQALRQVRYQSEAVHAAVKSLDLAKKQLEAEEKRHDEGISNYFQLLTAQQNLAQAQSTEQNARANYAKALAGSAASQGLIGEDVH